MCFHLPDPTKYRQSPVNYASCLCLYSKSILLHQLYRNSCLASPDFPLRDQFPIACHSNRSQNYLHPAADSLNSLIHLLAARQWPSPPLALPRKFNISIGTRRDYSLGFALALELLSSNQAMDK